jgi:GDP-mannose transporter
MGLITYRDFSADEARKCKPGSPGSPVIWPETMDLTCTASTGFPITLLLIGMIYTGSKALQFLSIPVYTIFKNLTIILIAYGEVLWFGGSVTRMTLFSFGLMVVSSIIAAWADIKHAIESSGDTSSKVSTLNAGYVWMMINCLCTSSYVLGMRKRIKLTNFKDFDSMFFFPHLLLD